MKKGRQTIERATNNNGCGSRVRVGSKETVKVRWDSRAQAAIKSRGRAQAAIKSRGTINFSHQPSSHVYLLQGVTDKIVVKMQLWYYGPTENSKAVFRTQDTCKWRTFAYDRQGGRKEGKANVVHASRT